jgi:hypothetical protein
MKELTDDEELVMKASFKATMLRAADIIDRITNADVMEAQAILFGAGVALGKVARIDRAMVAASYLRACAVGMAEDANTRVAQLREDANKL